MYRYQIFFIVLLFFSFIWNIYLWSSHEIKQQLPKNLNNNQSIGQLDDSITHFDYTKLKSIKNGRWKSIYARSHFQNVCVNLKEEWNYFPSSSDQETVIYEIEDCCRDYSRKCQRNWTLVPFSVNETEATENFIWIQKPSIVMYETYWHLGHIMADNVLTGYLLLSYYNTEVPYDTLFFGLSRLDGFKPLKKPEKWEKLIPEYKLLTKNKPLRWKNLTLDYNLNENSKICFKNLYRGIPNMMSLHIDSIEDSKKIQQFRNFVYHNILPSNTPKQILPTENLKKVLLYDRQDERGWTNINETAQFLRNKGYQVTIIESKPRKLEEEITYLTQHTHTLGVMGSHMFAQSLVRDYTIVTAFTQAWNIDAWPEHRIMNYYADYKPYVMMKELEYKCVDDPSAHFGRACKLELNLTRFEQFIDQNWIIKFEYSNTTKNYPASNKNHFEM